MYIYIIPERCIQSCPVFSKDVVERRLTTARGEIKCVCGKIELFVKFLFFFLPTRDRAWTMIATQLSKKRSKNRGKDFGW